MHANVEHHDPVALALSHVNRAIECEDDEESEAHFAKAAHYASLAHAAAEKARR